jgi:hypothetical protein
MKRVAIVAMIAAMSPAAVSAPAASAAGTPIGGLRWVLALDKRLPQRLLPGCVLITGLSWRESGSTTRHEPLYGTGTGYDRAKGDWSPGQRTGAVAGSTRALLFDSAAPKKDQGRVFAIASPGLAFSHGRLYLTGVIRRTRSLTASAAPRQRLALIARPRLLSGPARVTGRPPVPNTFLFAVQGDATITKAFASALNRARCKGRFAGGRPVRAGTRFGQITTQLLPQAAVALAGTIDIVGGLKLYLQDGSTIDVAPSGGLAAATNELGDGVLRATLPAGTATPLTCRLGEGCFPDGLLALPGQLTLSSGGRATVLAGLTLTFTPLGEGAHVTAVTATLDGAPVTVANDPDAPNAVSADLLGRVSAALGTTVETGTIGSVDASFTSTGPLS